MIDTERGLLTEYSLSNPPANKTTEIDNALTFALGKDKVWFTELTAGYIGYIDTSYHPSFSFLAADANLQLATGHETSIALILEGRTDRNLTITSSDSETRTSRPQSISLNVNEAEVRILNGQATITLNVAATTTMIPGDYTLLISATDGLVSRGVYLTLSVSS
jgi:hypothetical protein